MEAYQTDIRDRVWVEVDLDHLAHNIRALKEKIGPAVKLLPLLKANAYGCGIAIVGKIAVENGSDWLGVELVEEALELRRANIVTPILVVGPVSAWQTELIVNNDLHVTVRDEATLNAIISYAGACQKIMPVHVELDTGLHRLGFQEEDALIFIKQIKNNKFVELEGVWSHFASSDDLNSDFTRLQFEKYRSFISLLKKEGINVPIKHIANSAALIQYPEMRLNMARCGETVYGLVPRRDLSKSLNLEPVVEWKTRLVWIQSVASGVSVGYGQTWIAKRDSRIGTISVGYADGYRRSFSNRAHVLVKGKIAPVVGKLSMQMTMIDLTDIPDAVVNDEVVVMGRQGSNCVSAYDLAEWAGTGEFEILVDISARIPRYYLPPQEDNKDRKDKK
jgi:alanine racemase